MIDSCCLRQGEGQEKSVRVQLQNMAQMIRQSEKLQVARTRLAALEIAVPTMEVQVQAMRRADNLIGNALRYADFAETGLKYVMIIFISS